MEEDVWEVNCEGCGESVKEEEALELGDGEELLYFCSKDCLFKWIWESEVRGDIDLMIVDPDREPDKQELEEAFKQARLIGDRRQRRASELLELLGLSNDEIQMILQAREKEGWR